MTFGLRCSGPARRPHPASLPVRVPTVEGLPPASFSFASRLRLAVQLRLPSSAPIGSFHPIRFCPCWAHPAAAFQAAFARHVRVFDPRRRRLKAGCSQDWLPHDLCRIVTRIKKYVALGKSACATGATQSTCGYFGGVPYIMTFCGTGLSPPWWCSVSPPLGQATLTCACRGPPRSSRSQGC